MRIIPFLLILFSISVNAQKNKTNTKNGFALNGYDAISYFKSNPLPGEKKYQATYKNATYIFSSVEHRNIFNDNPKKYVPQYGGYCAYAVAKKGTQVSINPKSYEIRNGKLYLFYNAWGTNTLKLWQQENIDELIKKGDENWKRINNDN